MKILVVYDSIAGNTEKVAQAIGNALSGDIRVVRTGEVNPEALGEIDLLIVGSPTHGSRPTPEIKTFLGKIPEKGLQNIKVAAFDTRINSTFTRLFGHAASKIADNLKKKGGNLVIAAEGFIVEGSKGPLKAGELERAALWIKQISL